MRHSAAFLAVRDAILALNDNQDRARLVALFGNMKTPTGRSACCAPVRLTGLKDPLGAPYYKRRMATRTVEPASRIKKEGELFSDYMERWLSLLLWKVPRTVVVFFFCLGVPLLGPLLALGVVALQVWFIMLDVKAGYYA